MRLSYSPWTLRITLLFIVVALCTSEDNLCDSGSIDTICEVSTRHNYDIDDTNTFMFVGNGTVNFICNHKGCGSIYCSRVNCSIEFDLGGDFLMENQTSIMAQTVMVTSLSIFVSPDAVIDTSYLGDTGGPGKGDMTNGASYGGSGGHNSEEYFSYAATKDEIIGDPFDEENSFLIGSGTGQRGGGRVWLKAERIGIFGRILANGEDSVYYGAGGSGGTIILNASNMTIDQDASISAIGGMGNPVLFDNSSRPLFRYGGGGGGRVFLRYQQLECGNYDAIIAYGGPSNGGVRGLIGGAGTITHFVMQDNETISTYLFLDNRDLKSTAGTPVFIEPGILSGLSVQRTAVMFTTSLVVNSDLPSSPLVRGVSIRNGRLLSLQNDMDLNITSPSVSILQNSLISVKKRLKVDANEFRMSQATIKYGESFELTSKGDVRLDGTVGEEYTSSDSHLFVEALGKLEVPGTLNSQFIYLTSNVSIVISGIVKSQRSDCITDELCHYPYSLFVENRTLFEVNATQHYILLTAPSIQLEAKAQVEGGSSFLCAHDIIVNGIIDADGIGCPSGKGLSPGHASKHPYFCAGGGGYGGRGGQGASKQGGQGGDSCGSRELPLIMGSGGGSVSQSGGSGGGIIVINGENVQLLSKSVLSANGVIATSETSGGGSGGSVLVEATNLEFHGLVQANGGNGGENGGGGGGGGRIMFVIRNTTLHRLLSSSLSSSSSSSSLSPLSSETMELFTGNYSAYGGHRGMLPPTEAPIPHFHSSNNHAQTSLGYAVRMREEEEEEGDVEGDGEDGTVWTSLAPCDAGYGTVFCTICPAGTYKTDKDVSKCTPCTNGPEHSTYTEVGQSTHDCPFTCLAGYRGRDCLRPYDEFLRQIGGWGVVVVIALLFISVLVACTLLIQQYNRMRVRQYKLLEQSVPLAWYAQDIDRIRQKQKINSHYLTMGNLSDHVGRVYLNGHNTFRDPWRLPVRPPEQLMPLIFLPEYESFRDELNSLLSFSKLGEKIILFLLILLFTPVAYAYYISLRRKRAKLFEEYIAKGTHFFIRGPRAQALLESVKCGYDDTYSIAYVDILYLENITPPEGIELGSPCLPLNLAISGEGTPLNPYTIDLSDVLVSSIPNCKEFHKFIDKEYNKFLLELNIQLRTLPRIQVRNREDISELRDSIKEILNLFHINNPVYQYLISAGLRLDLAISWPNYIKTSTTQSQGTPFLSLILSYPQQEAMQATSSTVPLFRREASVKRGKIVKTTIRQTRGSRDATHREISSISRENYSTGDKVSNVPAVKPSIRDEALNKHFPYRSINASSARSYVDLTEPCRALLITQPFSPDQVQPLKSHSSWIYRLLVKSPTAPHSMTYRRVVKYSLALAALLDLFLTLVMNIYMWCWSPHHTSVCSPRAVLVSYLIFPFSIILCSLTTFVASVSNFYRGALAAFLFLLSSIPAIIMMLFFVNATPYVMAATTVIFSLLALKYIELRLLVCFMAVLETQDKITETRSRRKEESELRRTISVSDLGLTRAPSTASFGKVIGLKYEEGNDFV